MSNSELLAAFAGHDPVRVESAATLSLLSAPRLLSIAACLKAVAHLDGGTAEIGVAGGGTSQLIAMANGGRRHWICDTFCGLVDVGCEDMGLTNGMFRRNSIEAVGARMHLLPEVRLVEGYFPASAPAEMIEACYRFVHIDVDTYQSIHNVFEFFVPRMVSGGMIALDDVLPERSGCPGAQQAWNEISRRRKALWKVHSSTPPQVVVRFN